LQACPPLCHSAQGQPPLVVVRWPVRRVSPLTSQVAFLLHGSAAFFASPPGWKVFTASVFKRVAFPMKTPTLSRQGGFRSAGRNRPTFGPHRAGITVATVTQWATAIGSALRASLDPHSAMQPLTNPLTQPSSPPLGKPSRFLCGIVSEFRAATPRCFFIRI